MSIFNTSRGTGSFGKDVESMGSLFPVQATVMPSTSSVNVSNRASTTQQQSSSAMRSSSSSERLPQRAITGVVSTGRTGQTVSRTGTSSRRRSSGRGSNQASSSEQRTPVQKRVTAVEYISWAGPRSQFQVNTQTRQIYRNNYKYFPMVSDRDLPQIKSAIKWNLFSSLASDVQVMKPTAGTYTGDIEQASISFFDALSLDLTRPTSLSPETQRAYESVGLTDSSHVNDFPLAVFDLLRGVLTKTNWISRYKGVSRYNYSKDIERYKIDYLRRVTRQLRSLKSKRNEIL